MAEEASAASEPARAASAVPRAFASRLIAPIALGATLARRGPTAVVSMAISAATTVVFVALGALFGRRGGTAPIHDVPLLASSALAWGGGFLHVFSVAIGAIRRDRSEGIVHLLRSRASLGGHPVRAYVFARVGGLTLLVAAIVGGGTLLTGAGALVASRSGIGRTVQSTVAALAFALTFAFVVPPIAMAILGTRTRLLGYVGLLLLLVVPELIGATVPAIPEEVVEVVALPSALAALRASLAPGTEDMERFLRSLVALFLFASVAYVFVQREVTLLALEATNPDRPGRSPS